MRNFYDTGFQEDRQRIAERIPRPWGKTIAVGDGWLPIIIELDRKLAEIEPDYEIHQVKEKFGGLRFYSTVQDYDTSEKDADGRTIWKELPAGVAIREAEQQAIKTCEFCGEAGVLRNDLPWLKTLCDTHYEERKRD